MTSHLLLVGTSHRVAGLDRREQAVQSLGDVNLWLGRARAAVPAASELLVVATCHRIELYAIADDVRAAECELRAVVTGSAARDEAGQDRVYARTGVAAIEHLARVACGLDSMILGEAEIAGQVRRAARQCRAAGTVGPRLETVIAGALRASGRARSETHIARGVMSAGSTAVALASALVGDLRAKTTLVVGAGQTGRQALARLAKEPPARLLVASRSAHHAHEAAGAAAAEVVALEAIAERLADIDVVLVALTTPAPVLTAHDVAARASRTSRPLLIVDLSVPRAVDPAVTAVPGVTLRSVDDLGEVAAQSATRRAREVPRVEAIVRDEARRAHENLGRRGSADRRTASRAR